MPRSPHHSVGLPAYAREEARVDWHIDSGYGAAAGPDQPRDGAAHLARLHQPLQGGRLLQPMFRQRADLECGLERRRTREARRDRVDAHAGRAPFGRQRLRQVDDRRLGRAVAVHRRAKEPTTEATLTIAPARRAAMRVPTARHMR